MPDHRSLARGLDPADFTRAFSGIRLRSYQAAAARAIVDSVVEGRGLAFVVLFPRQSGKNELQAQIEAYLLALYSDTPAELVKVSPTWKPQTFNAMHRLERVLAANPLTAANWRKEGGYIYRVDQARITFLSGSRHANIVGATASTLLEVDEAQEIEIAKYDKEIAPMAASTNATRVFWGTAWTSRTLLARELRAARLAEQRDGRPRAFVVDAGQVAAEVPPYGAFVAGQVARLGRSHPMVRTQFFCEEIDAQGGLFPPERIERMKGDGQPGGAGRPGAWYALLIDVAGEDEAATMPAAGGEEVALEGHRRDATALTVVEVDPLTLGDPLLRAPTYRAVARHAWVGVKHARLYGELRALVERWQARRVVIDATGVGAGLASFLDRAYPGRVIPFLFNAASKSQLGWDFLSIVDTGRWKEAGAEHDPLTGLFYTQLAFCQYEVLPGPGKTLRWGVPDGTRDPATGQYVHDDLVMSAALSALLDREPISGFSSGASPSMILAPDPLEEMDHF